MQIISIMIIAVAGVSILWNIFKFTLTL